MTAGTAVPVATTTVTGTRTTGAAGVPVPVLEVRAGGVARRVAAIATGEIATMTIDMGDEEVRAERGGFGGSSYWRAVSAVLLLLLLLLLPPPPPPPPSPPLLLLLLLLPSLVLAVVLVLVPIAVLVPVLVLPRCWCVGFERRAAVRNSDGRAQTGGGLGGADSPRDIPVG